ncbi:MAG: dihydropteroate synthase [bacterium]|nr:dihydropteroate synthase [bacterium]
MISQLINLSNDKSFKLYKEKYNYSLLLFHGLYGIELRNISSDIFQKRDEKFSPDIFLKNNDLLITGSIRDLLNTISTTNLNHELKSEALKAIQNFEKYETIKFSIGKKQFDFRFAYSMGILNVTPDSFSDGGKYFDQNSATNYALKMIDAGIDIIDIGGESTRPGSEPVTEEEEINRVVQVIKNILSDKPETVISIDTTRANVARKALDSGAKIVNDISGGTFEPEIFNVAKEFDAAMIIMHIKGKPKTMQESPKYENVVTEVYDFLSKQVESADSIGINNIFIDPGIGFGKRLEDNLKLLERLDDFKSLGYPIVLGLSRKSFIGNILNLPVDERDDASNAMNAISLSKGARVIRTHNFKQAVETCKLFNSLVIN